MGRCIVTLTVDTEQINHNNILQTVTLRDESGATCGSNPEDFTSNIALNDELCWTGKAKNRSTGDTVTIDKITYESETNILGETVLHGDAQGNVLGVAVHGTAGDEEEYGIYFTVTKGCDPPVQYFLDPKLKIQT